MIPHEKQLAVLFRVEPGCLGPTGAELIEGFCDYINGAYPSLPFARFEFVPRHDKQLPELEYRINGHSLNDQKVQAYLSVFHHTADAFEEKLDENLSLHIDKYLNR